MHIAAISNSRIPSATANSIQAMKVCDALVEAGHEVRLLAPAEVGAATWESLADHYGIRHRFAIEWLPSRRALRRLDFVWSACRSAREPGPDLIYTWMPQAAALASRLGTPVVLEMHADVGGLLGAWWLRQFIAANTLGRLLVTTRALKAALELSTGMQFPEARVQLAPNGVDLERYRNLPRAKEARAQLGLGERPTVGFTGHFYAGRGIGLLHELARRLPGLNFLLVGGKPDAVAKWRQKLEAENRANITLTGFVENSRLPLYQAAADILVMPYASSVAASSGQDIAEVINPMKMFEYMAAGRAIMTADLPVIREVLDESCAVFCPAEDIASWTAAIEMLIADEGRRLALAEKAEREVRKYTWLERAKKAVTTLEGAS